MSNELVDLLNSIIKEMKNIDKKNKRLINKNENKVLLNSFIVEILEIIKIMQPVKFIDVLEMYKYLKKFSSFSFVKTNGKSFNKEIKLEYIKKLLVHNGLISIDENEYIRMSEKCYTHFLENENNNSLMFTFSEKDFNRIRSLILTRKYKNKEL